MTPYEEYERQLKEEAKKLKKQSKEKRKLEKKHAKEKLKLLRKNNAEIGKAMKRLRRDKETVMKEHQYYTCIQLDLSRAIKEYNHRRKMDFENNSLIDLLHKPK